MNDKQSALVEQLKNFGADSGKALKIKYNYPLSCCSTFRIGREMPMQRGISGELLGAD